mgnify:CR=1 FL=1
MAETVQVQTQQSAKPTVAEETREWLLLTPEVDIREAGSNLLLTADMPGCDAESIAVTLEDNTLTLEGSVNVPAPGRHRLVRCEFENGRYRRVFTLAESVDRSGITATFKNGVLSLTLPKAPEARTHKIQVQSG